MENDERSEKSLWKKEMPNFMAKKRLFFFSEYKTLTQLLKIEPCPVSVEMGKDIKFFFREKEEKEKRRGK